MFLTLRAQTLFFIFSGVLLIVGIMVGHEMIDIQTQRAVNLLQNQNRINVAHLLMGQEEAQIEGNLARLILLSTPVQTKTTSGEAASMVNLTENIQDGNSAAIAKLVDATSKQIQILSNLEQVPVLEGMPSETQQTAFHSHTKTIIEKAKTILNLLASDPISAKTQFELFEKEYEPFRMSNLEEGILLTEPRNEHVDYALAQNEESLFLIIWGSTFLVFLVLAYWVYYNLSHSLLLVTKRAKTIIAESEDMRLTKNTKPCYEMDCIEAAFNHLLEKQESFERSNAQHNERLNNSVIGLFSAMGALSQKDLTVRAPVTEDIIGTLGDAINQLTDVTATVLQHVTQVAGVVEADSERMKHQSDVVNEMAKEEDVIVVRLISNLEMAMASIGEVAIFARDSNRAAAEATISTESAMETVQATLVGMGTIRETISEMEKRIKRLGERSQEISQIVNLINTISERTHVLSLNAAMQAAMAGDAGRGFAVVAEEVQRLAENSRQATGQIANLVQNIQVETNDTIATVNKTIEHVINESDLATKAGEKMRETHETTARLVRLVATIATSSAEQTKIATVLRSAADEISNFTKKTSEQLIAQNQSAAGLVASSQKLVGAISVFKLHRIHSSTESEQTSTNHVGDKTIIFEAFRPDHP